MLQVEEAEMEQMVAFLKVLADRSRFRVLGLLSEREYTVKELAATLGLKEPTVSAHLTMLKQHDMVEMRPDGTSHHYKLRQDGIHRMLHTLLDRLPKEADPETTPDDQQRQVLNHFFQNGRLVEIPTQRKKQRIVLQRLVLEFAPDEQYTEKQVNEILKRFHPDCATLRRYLVDEKLMRREKSIYQRITSE